MRYCQINAGINDGDTSTRRNKTELVVDTSTTKPVSGVVEPRACPMTGDAGADRTPDACTHGPLTGVEPRSRVKRSRLIGPKYGDGGGAYEVWCERLLEAMRLSERLQNHDTQCCRDIAYEVTLRLRVFYFSCLAMRNSLASRIHQMINDAT